MKESRSNSVAGAVDMDEGVTATRFRVNHVNDNAGFVAGDEAPPSSFYSAHNNSDSAYILSLMQMTKEAIPRIDLYRNTRSINHAMRPTLEELHNGTVARTGADANLENGDANHEGGHGGHDGVKFGWIQGVLILNLMSLWGPMLFLRTSWLVGQGGLIQAVIVILFSTFITGVTALSTSAIATNGEVKGGGTYYILSRSLGPEYGGAIGLIFAFANMVGVATNIVGFCEAMNDLLKELGVKIVDGGTNDTRIIGIIAVIFCLIICIVGMEWEQKAQFLFLVILLTAMTDVLVGTLIPNDISKQAEGITDWSLATARSNLYSDYRAQSFISIFSVYFPSVTGILTGANISGELKDPQSSIPKGTCLAILITSSSYIFFAILSGFCIIRDATGMVSNGTIVPCDVPDLLAGNATCDWGLQNRYQMLEAASAFKWLIYAGNFSATLSSALGCLVGAPRVFQAMCRDRIFPYIHVFGKGYGKTDEPYPCYAISFIIAVGFILIAELNAIASIMSNFFMAAFCLINFAVFHSAFAKSPGFRPSFKYWNMWLSLFDAGVCLVVMFLMDYVTAIITVVICILLYSYLHFNKPAVNWGSSSQATNYRKALVAAQELTMTEDHVKNYRPQILVYSGEPCARPQLVDFSYSITRGIGLTICGDIIKSVISQRELNDRSKKQYDWLNGRKCKAFYSCIEEQSFERGAKALVQTVGVGKLRPNMILMGYKTNWQTCTESEVIEYVNVLHDAFDRHLAVGILRMQQGLDYSYFTINNPITSSQSMNDIEQTVKLNGSDSVISINSEANRGSTNSLDALDKKVKKNKKNKSKYPHIPDDVLDNINWFHHKQKKGIIDVWWLYDDGGLTLLIPYILSTRKDWANCQLRIFSLAHSSNPLSDEQRNMAALLSKFRIACADVIVLSDVTKPAKDTTVYEFNKVLSKFGPTTGNPDSKLALTENDLEQHKERSNRYMRIREYLNEYSRTSSMVVMTLPMPRKGRVPTALYMTWLEILTKEMPPVLLIRGNQTSVLTFYS